MRIFVTGASGFIGRHLLNQLGNHEIICLTRQHAKLEAVVAPLNVRMIEGELGRPEAWSAQVEKFSPHCCIHLSWQGLPDYSAAACEQNLSTGLKLIDVLGRAHVKRVVVAGSCWEYGAAAKAVAETDLPANYGLFAATKHKLREAFDAAARERGFSYRWARIFFAYGPGQRMSSLIPQCWTAFKAGQAIDIRRPRVAEDFIHVADVARGLLALAESDMASGIYNIGSGTPAAVGEVVNRVAEHFGMAPPYPDAGFDSGFWADMKKTTAVTGWRPTIALADGIKSTLRAFEAS